MGNAIAANMFTLGYAFQRGRVPLVGAAIRRAIELNGEAVKMNLAAFELGPPRRRRAARAWPRSMARFTAPTPVRHLSETLDEVIARRAAFLADYQDEAYAERYRALVARVREAEERTVANATALTDAVARGLFKLMAYKDEYEVARLYTDGNFAKQMAATFEGEGQRHEFHLAPPLLARKDPATGVPRKMTFGPWLMGAFRVLAKGKRLRGTPFDLFGYTPRAAHGAAARRATTRRWWRRCIAKLTPQNHARRGGACRPCRRRSAASGTSRRATWRRRRRRRRSFWPASAGARRGCRWRRSRTARVRGRAERRNAGRQDGVPTAGRVVGSERRAAEAHGRAPFAPASPDSPWAAVALGDMRREVSKASCSQAIDRESSRH